MRDGTGKLPTLDSHVVNGYGTETMGYNRKRNEKSREEKKTERIREVEERQQ